MKADVIEVQAKPNRLLKKFKTKISVFKHVKGDTKYDCENYDNENSYNDCISKELKAKFIEFFGCHSPLMSDEPEKICNNTFALTIKDESVRQLNEVYSNVLGDFKSNSCKEPCTKYIFETELLYDTVSEGTENAVLIVLDKNVQLTKTTFLIGFSNILTGLGGAISGGRTLLWIIISVFGFFKIFQEMKGKF